MPNNKNHIYIKQQQQHHRSHLWGMQKAKKSESKFFFHCYSFVARLTNWKRVAKKFISDIWIFGITMLHGNDLCHKVKFKKNLNKRHPLIVQIRHAKTFILGLCRDVERKRLEIIEFKTYQRSFIRSVLLNKIVRIE